MTTVTRDEWAMAALMQSGQGGVAAISVEQLARKLGVTKGSFYWHFENRNALIVAALELWQRLGTEHVMTEAQAAGGPRDKARRLLELVWDDAERLRVEAALLADAIGGNPLVRPIYLRVDRLRRTFIRSLYQELGYPAADARLRARSLYAAFLGSLQLVALKSELATKAELTSFMHHLEALYLPK